jgi:hypothetical protein
MLSDKRLENLLRDAHALEAFERVGAPPGSAKPWPNTARPGGGEPRYRGLLAAAAVLALIVTPVVLYKGLTGGTAKQTPVVVGTPDKAPDHPTPPPTSSLLLAVYQNDAGKFSCVNWSADALKGRAIASLTADELTRLGLTLACDPGAARILVVGLEGPAAALPTSDDRAKAVAQCLSTTPPCASGTFDPQTCASAGCLDNQVTVRIESLALK